MSTENNQKTIALLEQLFAAFNRHDIDGVMACMTDDVVFEGAAGPEAHGNRFVGADAVAAAFINVWTTMPDVQWKNTSHFAVGDRGVSQWTFCASTPDGRRIEADGVDLFTLKGGKLALKQAFRKDRPLLDPQ
ncbi:nuclear transport factor 2 family protein [Oceanimonas pelagia]|uniref:Nuclear transport factor 2 family protein n=1 Tax=Oceanimonas pelagia TaxID=3028314 RepID=A0AA50KQ09_9GAMM|nr:nuclear transport factor 2 family protein [Oceanimonas pelagia]WMC10970.1 nuclear transport factor 2 family protein [Oceanimonas pelagia]